MNEITCKKDSVEQPFISVLMTVCNTAPFLPAAIESILAETYTHYEFLIYDDLSTDDSPKILEQYVRSDSRIRVYHGQRKCPGIAHILKFLVSQSRGRYFNISDSDDICLPDRLQRLAEAAVQNPSCGIIFGGHRMVDDKGIKRLRIFSEPVWPYQYYLGGFIHGGASLISRRHYDMTEGFDEAIFWSADRDLYLKMLENTPFKYIQKVVYIYRRHMASRTFDRPADYDALEIIRQKACRRNLAIVECCLESGKTDLSYREYAALSYVTAYLTQEIIGPYRNDPVLSDQIMKRLGFTKNNALLLRHNLYMEDVKTINHLHVRIAEEIAQTKSSFVTSFLQFCDKNSRWVGGKAKRLLTLLRPEQ